MPRRPPPDAPPPADEPAARSRRRTLADGRTQTLLYLPPDLIKALKLLAVERESSVSQLVEEAVVGWLARARAKDEG